MVVEERHVKWVLREARRRGLTVRNQPINRNFVRSGKRINGSKRTHGPDRWMEAANNILYVWQKRANGAQKATLKDVMPFINKVELIKQLPGYLSHEHDGQRWFIDFSPPPWLDGEGIVINDDFFDVDYNRWKSQRTELIEQRKQPRNIGWTWDEQRQDWQWIAGDAGQVDSVVQP